MSKLSGNTFSTIKMDENSEKPKRRFKLTCCGIISIGCGGLVILFAVFVALSMNNRARVSTQEHLPTSDFAPGATNYSEYITFLNQYREFDISEKDFLEWCRQGEWKWTPVLIEKLPEMPPFDYKRFENENERREDKINDRRDIPLHIQRYCLYQPQHKDCSQRNCKIDPTGLTDDSCCRVVSKGYYYEVTHSNNGGVYVLYDFSNGRCYLRYARW